MDASREIQGNIHLCINSIFNVSRILGTYHLITEGVRSFFAKKTPPVTEPNRLLNNRRIFYDYYTTAKELKSTFTRLEAFSGNGLYCDMRDN